MWCKWSFCLTELINRDRSSCSFICMAQSWISIWGLPDSPFALTGMGSRLQGIHSTEMLLKESYCFIHGFHNTSKAEKLPSDGWLCLTVRILKNIRQFNGRKFGLTFFSPSDSIFPFYCNNLKQKHWLPLSNISFVCSDTTEYNRLNKYSQCLTLNC